MQKGRLFVFSGPSGAGKSTICEQLVKRDSSLKLSISMTTRAPRGAEKDGVSYYFVSHDEFERTIAENGLLEYTQVYANFYGTPKKPVLENLESGTDVILEIEMEGAMNVKKSYPDAVLVYVLPPSMRVLKEHLRGRGTESAEQLELRMKTSLDEIRLIGNYDYFIVNDNLEDAIGDARMIIRSEHLKVGDNAHGLIKQYEEEK